MSANRNLHTAKVKKKDVFYTQLTDIERELRHYTAANLLWVNKH